jgi:glycosyltransferase involved in cell wall biosynthesis
VVVLGDDMRVRVEAKGVPGERVVVVRDGACLPAAVPRRDGVVAPQVRGNDRFVVLHAGNVGFYGAWETLVRAAAQLSEEGVGFVFVGGGAAAGRVRALAASTGGPIRFLPFRPASEVPQVLAAADLHLVTVRRGLEGVVVPSKLFGILAAGRPVLAVAPEESDAARIVRRYRCGFVADPDSPGAVAHVVRQALTAPGELLEMGVRARAAAADFEQQRELDRLVRVVEEAARGESRRRAGAPGQKSEAIR